MPKFLIEREIPEQASYQPQNCKRSRRSLAGCFKGWGRRFSGCKATTGDKVYCVYIAPDEAMVREHAKQGGFPANRISEITSIIDPTTAEK